jgi:hypothetical protein
MKTWLIGSIAVLSTACSGALAPSPGESKSDGISANSHATADLGCSAGDAGAPPPSGSACTNVNASEASAATCQCASFTIPPAPPPIPLWPGEDDAAAPSPTQCSVIGTWDVHADANGAYPASDASFLFDDHGHFFGGEAGEDVCATTFMYGAYDLTGDAFEILLGYGMGPVCQPTQGSAYRIAFDATCTQATLTLVDDACTGGRRYIATSSTMTKRR